MAFFGPVTIKHDANRRLTSVEVTFIGIDGPRVLKAEASASYLVNRGMEDGMRKAIFACSSDLMKEVAIRDKQIGA